MKKIILVCMVLLFICGCTSKTISQPQEDEQIGYCDGEELKGCGVEGGLDMSSYEGFTDKENVFVKSDMEEAINIFKNKKSAILYFGFAKCPWCVEALPVMNDAAKALERSIYYVETRDLERNLLYTDEQKKEIVTYLYDYLDENDEGEKHLFVPFIVVVENGKVKSAHLGTIESHDAKERKMNDDEKKQLYEIYHKMFTKEESAS